LQKGDGLIYGHYLNEPGTDVPGMVFINKRGIFKTGRTWREIITKEQLNPSSLCWISKHGSVTFNLYGRDLPDGGMNEEGLYIWEMSEKADYPRNEKLPKLNQMTWMQYVLDNCSTLEEAISAASDIEIDGWDWHYFVADVHGNTAAIEFIDNKVVVYQGEDMPMPGLFNTPYGKELETIKTYKGFGGQYESNLNDPGVPNFVKTAKMIRDYMPTQHAVDYSFRMLGHLNNKADWNVVFDVKKRKVFFNTYLNPEIKNFTLDEIDFSNKSPVLIINMDIKIGGNVLNQFHPYSNDKMKKFTESFFIPAFPEEVFTNGGLTLSEFSEQISTLCDAAAMNEKQYFKGIWKNKPDQTKNEMEVIIKLKTKSDAVNGQLTLPKLQKQAFEINNIHLIANKLKFTCRSKNIFLKATASIDGDKMNVNLYGIEDNDGNYTLFKK
jgi:choloylglycine hydrolase